MILPACYLQGFRFAIDQDSGLDRRHAELVIRELAKFHAISYCMKDGRNDNLLNAYPYLAEDSLYRADTSDFTKRTITPVMASLAVLLRRTRKYEQHYEWFVDLARNFHDVSRKDDVIVVTPQGLAQSSAAAESLTSALLGFILFFHTIYHSSLDSNGNGAAEKPFRCYMSWRLMAV